MLKLNGAWLCGLSSVPQGSGLSRLRSSHTRQVSIRDTYERIVISGASIIVLEDAYWYSSEHWFVYVLTDPFLNLHLSHRYYVCRTVACLRTNWSLSQPQSFNVCTIKNHAARATFCCSCCSIRSISITMGGVRNSFRMFLWCDSGWCFVQ